MKWLLLTMLLAAASAQAQIFHCETPEGPVFSDTPCSDKAEVINVESESAGIAIGPSEEVRAELDQKRAQRAEDRQQARRLKASQPQQPVYMPVPAEQSVIYPGVWPWRPGYRQHPRPPGARPKPDQPTRPPMLLPESGGSLIRIPKR